jgi:Flagellar biosynthesis protein, FliO
MELIETLSLGGKRQLMLVRCGGQHFLVGGGFDTVETIVPISGAVALTQRVERDALCG